MNSSNGQFAGAVALLFGIFLVAFLGKPVDLSPQLKKNELRPVIATSTLGFNPDIVVTRTALEKLFPSQPATTTKSVGPAPTTPKPKPTPSTATTTQPVKPVSAPQAVQSSLKTALVNILCTSKSSSLQGLSGSGVFIDPRGIIITAAHVAQAELLSEELGEGVISCVIRTGNPARTAYKARLIYISEAWLRANSTTLISSQPIGTGENDFALLVVTAPLNGNVLPSSFPYLALSERTPRDEDAVYLGGYGGQYLTSAQIRTAHSPLFSSSIIEGVYTFHTSTADILSILGGEVAQIGSSGGGVVDSTGRISGLITTSEVSGDFAERELRAITPIHINDSFSDDMGVPLASYLQSASPSALISSYQSKVSELGDFLARAIGQK